MVEPNFDVVWWHHHCRYWITGWAKEEARKKTLHKHYVAQIITGVCTNVLLHDFWLIKLFIFIRSLIKSSWWQNYFFIIIICVVIIVTHVADGWKNGRGWFATKPYTYTALNDTYTYISIQMALTSIINYSVSSQVWGPFLWAWALTGVYKLIYGKEMRYNIHAYMLNRP